MARLYQRYVWWSLLAGALAALVVGGAGALGWYFTPMATFHEAQARWRERPVPHYRLVIERPSLSCQQDVEVRHEQIVRVFEHTCPIEMLTMTDLFERIARLDGMENFAFMPQGVCGCESELNAYVVYDTELGYPTEVGITDLRTLDVFERACWQHLLVQGSFPECNTSFLPGDPRITHISLTPLP
jgi:hypothetical protein